MRGYCRKPCALRATGERLGALGWAELGLPARGGSMRVPAGAAQGLAPSLTTISKLQTPSPWRWQVANEIAELVKKWLTRALAEE